MHCAVSCGRYGEGHISMMEALVHHGADINAPEPTGRTLITTPALLKLDNLPMSLDVARYLIEAGADVDAEDQQQVRAVEHAVAYKNVPMVRYLVDIGAGLRLQSPRRLKSIIHIAAMKGGIEMWDLLKDLVHRGYFPNLESHIVYGNGLTPWDYFEDCQYQYAYGDWRNYDVERERFAELMDAIEAAILTKPVYLFGPPRRDSPTATVGEIVAASGGR
jgi:hypothetical protein